ncbi:MAG: hypothetical protein Q7S27_04105 [Nanoarchaeota archaeon]|nr:hypothetical protein [Nanoarchaeota archaeon]
MKAFFAVLFVVGILGGLFFSLFSLFKLVFLSLEEGIESSVGDILTSPPSGQEGGIFISAILAGLIAVLIVIFESGRQIIKRRKN